MNGEGNEDRQDRDWEALNQAILESLATAGFEEPADCYVVDENWGGCQQKIEVFNLTLLQPGVIKSLQGLLKDYPGWEIRLGVRAPKNSHRWPVMGLTVRVHEVIDGLQRQYLPAEFHDIRYDTGRPGTEND